MYFHTPTFRKALALVFTRRPFSFRHAFFALTFSLLFLILRALVMVGRMADDFLYPDWREQKVQQPIFIIGNPRSGTTFAHRLMAEDERFTCFKLWQTIFPAVTYYKLFGLLGRLDRKLGSPLGGLLALVTRRGLSGWEKMHTTGPGKVESDEMLFVYAFLSPLVSLLFPYLDALPQLKFPDRLPTDERDHLRLYFKDCLKRHVYATRAASSQEFGPASPTSPTRPIRPIRPVLPVPDDKLLLEKVALIAGRLRLVLSALPDMRIVHLVRHPYQSVPSLMSMLHAPLPALAPQHAAKTGPAMRQAAIMIFEYYRTILEVKRNLSPERYLEIRYEDLVADPSATILRIYDKFGIPVSPAYKDRLDTETRQARSYNSNHSYRLEDFGLSKAQVYAELKEVFEEYGFEP